MKKWILLIACLLPALGGAQNYNVKLYRINGGGGSSCNWQYCESGVILPGTLPSGPLTGGSYSLRCEVWSSTTGSSRPYVILSIRQAGGQLTVSWPDTGGFLLQQSIDLAAAAGWATSAYPVKSSNGVSSVTISPPPPGNLFFRLFSPGP